MKEIRFAFIGFGNIAKTHMVALKAMPIVKKLPFVPVLDTLVTRQPGTNQEQARAIGFERVVGSLEEALAAGNFQVVDICTPNVHHPDAFIPAVKAGKTVYCEKPLADRYAHSQAMAQAAGGQTLHQVALVYRYHPAVLRIREALRTGMIGDVLQCRCSYRRSGYLNASRPVSWRLDAQQSGGGAISDLGIHVLDLLRHLIGEIGAVEGQLQTFVKSRPSADPSESGRQVDVKVDDWGGMEVTHLNGVVSYGEVSRIAWGTEAFQLDIVGTMGAISCDLEKDYVPRIKMLDGSTPATPQPEALKLLTDDKSTMGMAVDTHFGALHHFLLRLAGEDPYGPGLAPGIDDALQAEYWIDHLLRRKGGLAP